MKIIPKFFSKEECFNLILLHKNNVNTALVVDQHNRQYNPLIRKTKVFVWSHDVNLEHKFQSSPMVFQFAEYSQLDHYNWHNDYITHNARKRIETCIVNLNNEYKGGEFELKNYGKIELDIGDCLRFDSRIDHKVYPVLKGKRYSLTGWVYEPYSIEKLLNGEEEFE